MEVWLVLSSLYAILQAVMVITSKYIMKNLTPVATLTYLLFLTGVLAIPISFGRKFFKQTNLLLGQP